MAQWVDGCKQKGVSPLAAHVVPRVHLSRSPNKEKLQLPAGDAVAEQQLEHVRIVGPFLVQGDKLTIGAHAVQGHPVYITLATVATSGTDAADQPVLPLLQGREPTALLPAVIDMSATTDIALVCGVVLRSA